jgi:hypothetical protein
MADREKDKNEQSLAMKDVYGVIEKLHQTALQSEYQVGQFIELIKTGHTSQATSHS